MSTNSVICIIGMHRSGTSMVARLLQHHGLYLGSEDQLLGPNPDNLGGHFEHTGFLNIDDRLLQRIGASWDYPPRLEAGWELDVSLEDLRAEARSLVGTFRESLTWGWKEPRTTILLPFWKSIIPDLRFVICVRSPLDVSKSLVKRNQMSIDHGYLLWDRYLRAAIQDTEGCPRLLTVYDNYFANYPTEVDKLIRFCGLDQRAMSSIPPIISPELRHHASETTALLDCASLPTNCKMLYIALRALSLLEFVSIAGSDEQEGTSDKLGKILRLIDELQDQYTVDQLQNLLAEKERLLSISKEELIRKDQRLTQLEEHAARLQTFSDAVRQTLAYRFYRKFIKPLQA